DYGFAWQAGLRRGSRLVEVCKVAAVALSHEQMIDLLRTSVTVRVVIVPPHEDGTPRRGWSESLELSSSCPAEPKADPEPFPAFRPPFRSSAGWQWSGPAAPKRAKAPPVAPHREPPTPHGKRPLSFPETPHAAPAAGAAPAQPYRQPSG
ncbi:signal-induced proliferation-associated 1-like protein 3, partial [Neopelma chrysocephalum]|uniref:signal-induced proliferation-associated 1-like protein 3 n=1 Tax=Neopelma chrysocephalum TaxID=114329 RepID=UPI000FCD2F5C